MDVSSAIEEDNRKMEDGYVFERQDYPYTQTDSDLARTASIDYHSLQLNQ